MLKRRQQIAGFTLIEAMVTLSVLAIVMALGTPALTHWVRRSELRSGAENLRNVLQKARAEAIARNARVRIILGDSKGIAAWSIACIRVSASCPEQLLSHAPQAASAIRWGAALPAQASDLSTALTAGAALPGSVDFHPLGDAPQIASGTGISRIDVWHARDEQAGRLIVRIDGAGNVSLCDPLLSTADSRGCH